MRLLCAGLYRRALGPLLDWAEAVVPRKQWERTPIFLFGTAGLRKLPKEAQHTLLIDLRDALAQCSFRCAPKLVHVLRHVLKHRKKGIDVSQASSAEKTLTPLCYRRFEPAYANIISGEDEGMFGWIAVNYLKGKRCASCAHCSSHRRCCCPQTDSATQCAGVQATTAQARNSICKNKSGASIGRDGGMMACM